MKQRLRHLLWYLFVAVILIPALFLALGHALYEMAEAHIDRVRVWCWREQYIPRARKPGQP